MTKVRKKTEIIHIRTTPFLKKMLIDCSDQNNTITDIIELAVTKYCIEVLHYKNSRKVDGDKYEKNI